MILRRYKDSIEHTRFNVLQIIAGNDKSRMRQNLPVGKRKRHFDDFPLMNLRYSHFSSPFVMRPPVERM